MKTLFHPAHFTFLLGLEMENSNGLTHYSYGSKLKQYFSFYTDLFKKELSQIHDLLLVAHQPYEMAKYYCLHFLDENIE